MDIELRLLGALEVAQASGETVPVRGLGARLLLALAVDRGSAVADHDLLERLWPEDPPAQAIASVRNQVARLRRLLGSATVERTSHGYRLDPDTCRVDVDLLAQAIGSARTLDPEAAAELLECALSHVRGRPLDDVADELWAMPAAAAAAELVANAEELWADAVIATGHAGENVVRLRRAAIAQPHREERWRQLVTALAGAGRRTEGLRAVGEARRALAEFGLLPSADLVELERSLVGATDESPTVTRIPVRRDPMVGREIELAALLRPLPTVWIDGEPGSGKTRLLAELADRQTGGRDVLLYAACPHLLGSGAGVLSSFINAATEVSAELGATPDELVRWRDHEASDRLARRATLVDGLVSWLQTASRHRPITVVIDDAHWLDDDTIAVLLDVVGQTREVVRWVIASRAIERHPPAARMRDELERAGSVYSLSLGALTLGDVHDLIDLLAPGRDGAARDALAREVMSSTGGHPLSVAEMISHRQRRPDGDPPRLDAIVRDSVRALPEVGRDLVQLLAVAGGPCPVAVLAATLRLDAANLLELAERLEGEGLLAPVTVTSLDLRHDLIRRAVVRRMSPAAQLGLRRRLVGELADDERFVIAAADQMLHCGDLLEDELIDRRDRAVADAIERLMMEAEYTAAKGLAERYLAIVGGRDVPQARAARLRSATALIANGEAATGRATLFGLIDQSRASDDQIVLADAILAMGPLSLGARERDGVIRDAERLIGSLPSSEGRRRVQLACWAAHHRVNRGEGVAAAYLLRQAEEAAVMMPVLNGLILAVRAQASTLIGSGPGPTRRALDELGAFVRSSGDPSSEAALLLLSSRQAWVDGAVADVVAIRDALARMATRMPRPDFQWWPLALDAAVELATGRGDAAASIELAGRTGRQLGVEVAGSTELAQQLLLLFLNGQWAAAAGSLEALATAEDASPSLLAAFGLACAEAGRLDAAADIAARLVAAPQLLERSAMTWGQVAVGATAVAAAARDISLAEFMWRSLEPYSGTGMALPGAGYFGTVDRCLGLLAATLGDRQRGLELLASACAQEHRRGATVWEQRATADLRTVRNSGVRAVG